MEYAIVTTGNNQDFAFAEVVIGINYKEKTSYTKFGQSNWNYF